jgi:hypothetical protein
MWKDNIEIGLKGTECISLFRDTLQSLTFLKDTLSTCAYKIHAVVLIN